MPNCPPDEAMPTANIEKLAKYAKQPGKSVFRGNAAKKNGFLKAVDDELKGDGKDQFAKLCPHEVLFCEGWVYLAEREYLDAAGNVDDGKLVAAIERHLKDDEEFGAMSG